MKATLPKAVRGCSLPGFIRINSRQLATLFRDPDFRFTGFIVGNNVSPFHFFGGWHLACRLDGLNREDFDRSINSFLFYLDPELGTRAVIFVRPSAIRRASNPAFVPTLPLLAGGTQ